MEQVIDFTIGFSENVAWPWPIAVYLFLAGISGGAFAAAALVRIFRKQTQITPLFQAASFIALVTILLGMICLVFDLTKPLDFWKILIFYNLTSVMSVGVMALLVFIPTMFLVTLVSFYEFESVKRLVDGIPCGAALLSVLRKILPVLTWIGLVFALTVCAYTGFLISALVRFPLINTAVLPALFVASGLSAGIACNQLGAVLLGESHENHDVHVLHVAEWPVMVAEALCIFMIAFALMTGIESAQMAAKAFVDGFWATEFWIGVVGVGFVLPVLLAFFKKSFGTVVLSALCSVVGMMCLRFFILYAGQLNAIGGYANLRSSRKNGLGSMRNRALLHCKFYAIGSEGNRNDPLWEKSPSPARFCSKGPIACSNFSAQASGELV